MLLRVRVGERTDQRHGEQEAGVDRGGEEGGRDGDPHTSSLVASEDCEGDPDPAGDGNEDSDHQAAPASPAQHLSGRPVGGGDSQEVPGPSGQVRSGQVRSGQVRSELWRDLSPVELQYEQTTKEEADQHTDGEGVQLSLQTDPDELLVLDGQTEDDGQDGPHQRRDQHTGYQLDRGVLHQAWTAQCQTKKYLF